MKPVVILQHELEDPPGLVEVALRELRVPYEIRRLDKGDSLPAWPDDLSALIALGGSGRPYETKGFAFLGAEQSLMRRMLRQGAPVWGISLGAEILTLAAGGDVFRLKKPELGWITINKAVDDPLLKGIASPFAAFSWHEYSCQLPPTAHLVAGGHDGVQVYRAGGCSWATQFHLEVDAKMLPHWLDDAAKQHREQGPDFVARLRDDPERSLPSSPALCPAMVRNFVSHCGLLAE
jgi:GMP synthase-like glutamine amidotransferase